MVQPPPLVQQQQITPENKKYYELPAGLSVLCGWVNFGKIYFFNYCNIKKKKKKKI